MLLTREVSAADGELELAVTVAPFGEGTVEGREPRDWGGVLFGAGEPEVDYRISAQVHHRPAADRGWIVAVDPYGKLDVFDNHHGKAAGGTWSIGGALSAGELACLASAVPAGEAAPRDALRLALWLVTVDGQTTLEARASDAAPGALVSEPKLDRLTAEEVDGLVGLVSYLGPEGSAGFTFADFAARSGSCRQGPSGPSGRCSATWLGTAAASGSRTPRSSRTCARRARTCCSSPAISCTMATATRPTGAAKTS